MSSSINDLLEQLTSAQGTYERKRERPKIWRICLIVPNAARLWRDERDLLLALTTHGFSVHVIAHDEGVFDELKAHGILTCAIPQCEDIAQGLLRAPVILPIMQGYLIEHPPALLHVENEPLLSLTWLATKLLDDAPFVLGTLRGLKSPVETLGASELVQRFVPGALLDSAEHLYWQSVIDRVDLFLTTSRAELEHLMAMTTQGVHRKLEVWPGASGYDAHHVNPERPDLPSKDELRVMGEIPDTWQHLIGVAGDFEADVERLIATITRTTEALPHSGWVLAKPAGEAWALEVEARLKALGTRVMWLEPGELGMPLFLALVDVYYCPRATSARVATSVLEAQAMGTPVVAFDVGLNATYIEDGETGFVLKPSDASHGEEGALNQVVAHIAALVGDPALAGSMGRAARERARKLFSRKSSHEQLMRLYDRLLSRRYA